jgi:hypothetical protein
MDQIRELEEAEKSRKHSLSLDKELQNRHKAEKKKFNLLDV